MALLCRTMCADHFSTMALPVAEFLALEHGTEYSGARAGKDDDDEPVVSTQQNCTVQLLVDSRGSWDRDEGV